MATDDVPGANPANGDKLAMGCWAEHKDGSLIFVESTEGERVVYSIFDMSKTPIVEYRDAMPAVNFKQQFSWRSSGTVRWTWHDKTPFPWDRVIRDGAQDGSRLASAADTLTAAERVAESLRLRARDYDHRNDDRAERRYPRVGAILDKLHKTLDDLGDALERRDG